MLEDVAYLYHKLEPGDKYFYPFLKYEAVSEEIDILCEKKENITDYEFLCKLSMHRKNQKNMFKDQYSSVLELIDKSGTNPERFFSELLQNIDDCIYRELPSVTIKNKNNGDIHKLYVEYNEIGFSREQVRAITAIGDSTKKKMWTMDTTGEKGIGFKSLFSLCKEVEIESGNFCFSLSADTPTVPEKIKKIDYYNGSRMTFILKPVYAEKVDILINDECKIINYCLCLKQVHNLFINQKKLVIEDKETRRVVLFGKNKYQYFHQVCLKKIENKLAIAERKKSKEVSNSQKIDFLVPLDNICTNYVVYSTLPTQEKIKIPMIINMSLDLDTARERILDSEWNREIIHQMMEALIEVYDKLKILFGEKISQFFPQRGSVLDNKLGNSYEIEYKIINNNLFKLAYKDEYISLKKGVFSRDFEYKLYEKNNRYITQEVKSILLKKNDNYFERLKSLFGEKVKERTFYDICLTLNEIFESDKAYEDIMNDCNLRDALYNFLAYSKDKNLDMLRYIKKWKIIPISYQGKTLFEQFSDEIYAPGDGNVDSAKYKILNNKVMSEEIYNSIFSKINGQYKPLRKFSKDVIIATFFEEVLCRLKTYSVEARAQELLDLFNEEKDLFVETVKLRKDFPFDSILLKTRTGDIYNRQEVFICRDANSQGCLDKMLVDKSFMELAVLIDTADISEIDSYDKLSFEIGRSELRELNKNKYLCKKKELFASLYTCDSKSKELNDGIGFLELYSLTPEKIRKNGEQSPKVISIDLGVLYKYVNDINDISLSSIPIVFKINMPLYNFDNDGIVREIEDELQIRKETENIKKIVDLITNCYYADIGRREPCCIRTDEKNFFIIDRRIIADYDIIEVLKGYFLKYFSTEISVNRNIHLYDRRGVENIITIDSTEENVMDVVDMLEYVDLTDLETIKDFLCKPLTVKGITYGGYAKCCPLCGTRVNTELTGMRIYKIKCNGVIVPLICCCNCHENLRYASNIAIDVDELKNGYLNVTCQINGYDWTITNKKIRLGHRALIHKINLK